MTLQNTLSSRWDDSHRNIPAGKDVSRYAELQIAEIMPDSSICDLGGGTGADSIFFAQQGHKVNLYDISPVALSLASSKATELSLNLGTSQADFGSDDFALPEETYDFLYSRLALHYFPSGQLSRILAEVYSSLKKGGKAKITLKSPADPKEMSFLQSTAQEIEQGVFNDEGQVKTRFNLDQLKSILLHSGIPEGSYSVAEISEDLGGRVDAVKSGNKVMFLNEITITK